MNSETKPENFIRYTDFLKGDGLACPNLGLAINTSWIFFIISSLYRISRIGVSGSNGYFLHTLEK